MSIIEMGFYICAGILLFCVIIGWIWPRREL